MENEHDEMYEKALDWFVTNKDGGQENPAKFLWKSMIKGYKVKTERGTKTYKLTPDWFKRNMSEKDWLEFKRQILGHIFIGFTSYAMSVFLYNSLRIHCDGWSEDMETAVNGIIAMLYGRMVAKTMNKLFMTNYRFGGGEKVDDNRIKEVS